MNTPDAKRKGMRLTAVALALTLLGGFAVADGFAAPPAEAAAAAATDPAPPMNFYPTQSGGSGRTTGLGANPCPSLETSNPELFTKLSCTAKVISTLTVPPELVPEVKLGNVMGNCSAVGGAASIGVGGSVVKYVEEGLTTSESRSNGVTMGISVAKQWGVDIAGFKAGVTITASVSNTNSWEHGTSIAKSVQAGDWVNNDQSIQLPPYSWGYFAFRTQMRQVDLLWQWTPDPSKPDVVSTDVQTLTTRDVKSNSDATGNGSSPFGVVLPHVSPMNPAEIRACWERTRGKEWKAGDPILTYTPSAGELPNPFVEEPAMLRPVDTVPLDSYPFIYSVAPLSNPVTRNIERAQRQPFNGPKSQANFDNPDREVNFWQLKNGGWTESTTTSSIVMPPGSEVGFWTGNACNRLTAQIGGSSTTNRDFEQRVEVFQVRMVDGKQQYGASLGKFVVPNPGKSAGNTALGKLDLVIPKDTESIAIRTYRVDKKVQTLKGDWIFSGSRDTVVISEPKIECDPPDEKSRTYIRSSYEGEVKSVLANLAATPAQVQGDPYLNMRPNATPYVPYSCNPRPDYIGWACNGTPTISDGVAYKQAIGLHSNTSVTWGLTSPTCSAFQFEIAWDDHVAGHPDRRPVTFTVTVDGTEVQTGRMNPYPDSNKLYSVDQAITLGPHTITVSIKTDDTYSSAAHVNLINPRLVCKVQPLTRTYSTVPAKGPSEELVPVGSLTWSNEVNWYARALRNQNAAMGGGPLVMAGITYPEGIGVHSLSSFDVKIPRTDCTTFTADVGVLDSGINPQAQVMGTVRFEVWGDGKPIAQTGIVRYGEMPTLMTADISGLKSITLKVLDGGDNPYQDHAAWGRPILVCADTSKPVKTPDTSTDPSTPPTQPAPVQTVDISAAKVQWAGNENPYRQATRGTNVDTGNRVSIDGTTFDTAIAQVSEGKILLTTLGQCTAFTATVGVDDYAKKVNAGSLKFELWGDGVPITSTPVMYWYTPATTISAAIPGVKSLELRITNGGDGINWDHGVWGNPTLTCLSTSDLVNTVVNPSKKYISEMNWRTVEASDFEVRRNLNMMNTGPVRIANQEYERGIGAHSWSVVRVPIATTCSTFSADIGIDDTAGDNGSVTFQVWGDSTMLYESAVLRGSMDKVHIEVPLNRVSELALTVTDAWDGHAWDHGSWGDPQVTCLD